MNRVEKLNTTLSMDRVEKLNTTLSMDRVVGLRTGSYITYIIEFLWSNFGTC
ncbi:hypothetical protein [Leptospira interrogans]|uniref:hypothetical protein n=1 Tax=Leptospira interrogans TaxID=173 RepID=UPI0012FAAD65|nr:hypothetical protein [Leptospira interrogans]